MFHFMVGDTVCWASEANGVSKVKKGTVVCVVPANSDAVKAMRTAAKNVGCMPSACGSPREHESYIIHVPTNTGRGKGKLYWPQVKNIANPVMLHVFSARGMYVPPVLIPERVTLEYAGEELRVAVWDGHNDAGISRVVAPCNVTRISAHGEKAITISCGEFGSFNVRAGDIVINHAHGIPVLLTRRDRRTAASILESMCGGDYGRM